MDKKYNFDPLCLELAAHFLADNASESAKNDLAQVIQDAVDGHRLNSETPMPLAALEVRMQ